MSRSHPQHLRPLLVLHLLAVIGLALWWGLYFWQHTPARRLPPRPAHARPLKPTAPAIFSLDPLFGRVKLAIGDVAFGTLSVLVVALGTRVYARRLQIWLDARTSGEAVSYGTSDLASHALAANADRRLLP
jgi:hypothetical protein